jgi:microcystin-dependent protein
MNPQFPVPLNTNKLQEKDIKDMPEWFKSPLDFLNKLAETLFYAQEAPIMDIFQKLNQTLDALLAYLRADGIDFALDDNPDWANPSTTAGATQNAIANLFTGCIIPYGGSTAPTGFVLCNGAAISRTVYANLFSAIGTTYGVGDGSTTFNLPNLQGVAPKGAGSQTINGRSKSGGALGEVLEDRLQGHRHPLINASVDRRLETSTYFSGSTKTSSNVYQATAGPNVAADNATGDPIADTVNGTPRTGDSTRDNSLAVNYIIKY